MNKTYTYAHLAATRSKDNQTIQLETNLERSKDGLSCICKKISLST